jgi:hypothetical protein
MAAEQVTTKNTTKIKIRIAFILFCGALLILGAFWSSEAYLARRNIESYAVINTRNDIELFANAIKIYIQDKDKLPFIPPGDKEFIIKAKSLYPVLFKSKMVSMEMPDPPPHWKAAENIVDRWNNELNVIAREKVIPEAGDSVKYYLLTIWSNGPNQVNDNGEKDDIVGTYLIEYWVDLPAIKTKIKK